MTWRVILLMSFTADGSEQAQVSLSGPVSARRVGQIIRMLELTRDNLAEDDGRQPESLRGAAEREGERG